MKKIFALGICIILLTCSCGKFDINKAKEEFKDKVTSSKGYELKGNMEIYNNEDTFKYDIVVNYKKDDNYKVSMINKNNNHEQIILKNDESVYVVTPSLNKSFKFESEWPDNSSQSYILSSLVNDVVNDESATLKEKNGKYEITAKVNYPHNQALVNQKLYFDKDMNLEQVIVYDNNKNEKIKVKIKSVDTSGTIIQSSVKIKSIDYKAKYKDNYFELNTLIDENTDNKDEKQEKETMSLDEAIYPLYVPANTFLKSEDKVEDEQKDRTILTFNGDKSFILVEEAANVSKEFEIIPVNGDPLILSDSVAALSDNSLSWTSNNIDYYLTSSNLSTDELMTIAESMGNVALEK